MSHTLGWAFYINAYLEIEVSFNSFSAERINWPDSIKNLVATMNLCESSILRFLEKQFQNEFEILLRPPIMMSLPIPEPPPLDGLRLSNIEMPVFLPPPRMAIDKVGFRNSLNAKMINFLKARENDFLFTLMFRRCWTASTETFVRTHSAL